MKNLTVLMVILFLLVTPIALGQDGEFSSCIAEDLETLLEIKSGFDAVWRQAFRTSSADSLLNLTKNQYEWRQDLIENLPRCAEAVEIGWLMSQVSGDAVAIAALEVDERDSKWILVPTTGKRIAMEDLLDELKASLRDDESTAAQSPEDEKDAACSEAQLLILAPQILLRDYDVLKQGLAVQTARDYVQYAFAYFDWREELWSMLPHCEEAIEFGLLINQGGGDIVAMYAHQQAGISNEDNPSRIQFEADTVRMRHVREAVVEKLDRNRTVRPYFVTAAGNANVRSCGSTSCEVVAVVRRGDELRVLDDSGDWYEIRLPSGEIAYIAGFLAGISPPE